MDFDIRAMKKRAKMLLGQTKPSPWIAGVIWGILVVIYVVAQYTALSQMSGFGINLLCIMAIEFVYINFRVSSHWYCIKVTREETTSTGDAFAAWKYKPIKAVIVGILKDLCVIVGLALFFVPALIPLYWFRFSTYVIYDEEINVFKALAKSKRLLKGHYVELIKLDISNLGWFVLTIFTLGLGSFYVKPYLTLVYAEYYDYLKGQAELFG